MSEWLHGLLAGSGPLLPFIALVALGAGVFFVASRLAHDADAIAEETGWGGLWIGSLLLAAATSLPEVITDVNAVLLGVPDIGAGDLFGSCMANMAILAAVNLIFIRKHMFKNASPTNALIGIVAILLTVTAGIGIATWGVGAVGFIAVESIFMVLFYLAAMRILWQLSQENAPGGVPPIGSEEKKGSGNARLRDAWLGFGAATVALLVLAPVLVTTAEIFANETGLTTTFVGTLIIGLTTSFPEMSAVFAAVRMGSYDLAVGDILGSNAFNMLVFLAMDLVYLDGSIFSILAPEHVLTVMLAVVCMALGIFAILYRSPEREGPAYFESVLILGTYFGGMALLSGLGAR